MKQQIPMRWPQRGVAPWYYEQAAIIHRKRR